MDGIRNGKLCDGLWLLLWGLASSLWCVTAAGQLSATFDEPIYVTRGLEGWRSGSHAGLIRLGTMPLPADVQTLPLYLAERARGVPFDPIHDLETLLPWARAGTLFFWWLLLFYGWRAGRDLAGPWGGRLAVVLLACEPSLLAHAALATTDIALTACLLALAYHYRRGRDRGWFWRVGVPAFWFGATLLAKASGLAFGPLVLLAIELERRGGDLRRWWRQRGAPTPWQLARSFLRDLIPIGLGGLLLTFVYCGSDWQPQPSFVSWAQSLPDGWPGRTMLWLAENLRIFSNAGEGLVRQVKHNMNGHDGTYLLGSTWPRSVWYYFPLALTMKLSPLLLLLPLLLALLRPRSLANWACLATALLLVFSLNCRVQIGIRLVLPLVVFAMVGLAAAVVRTCRAAAAEGGKRAAWRWRPALLTACLVAGLTGTLASDVAVWPEALCYTNEFWGGTPNGYRCLSDSNYDWGQGLKELAQWQERHPDVTLDVWYFGTDPAVERLPARVLKLHVEKLEKPEEVQVKAQGHYLAVSTTLLYGMVCDTPEHRLAAEFLRRCQPVDRTTTFLIYDFTKTPGACGDVPQAPDR